MVFCHGEGGRLGDKEEAEAEVAAVADSRALRIAARRSGWMCGPAALPDAVVGAGLGFVAWGESQADALKEPPTNERLKQDLTILHGFKVPGLKELLSAQILFNVSISQAAPQGIYGSAT